MEKVAFRDFCYPKQTELEFRTSQHEGLKDSPTQNKFRKLENETLPIY